MNQGEHIVSHSLAIPTKTLNIIQSLDVTWLCNHAVTITLAIHPSNFVHKDLIL
jgi:hypothetical protein